MTNIYTADHAGCYVDGSRGIYSTDAIVDFARHRGAVIDHDPACTDNHADTCHDSEFAGCEWAGDYEREADEYMNQTYPVDGHFWGRNENGDWGLWSEAEWS